MTSLTNLFGHAPANVDGCRGVLLQFENVDGDERRLFIPDHQIPSVIKALAEDLEKLRAMPGKYVLDRQLDELSGFGPEDQ